MNTAWADLHLHSCCSDGADTPDALVARAADVGATAIALTDHDTVAGVTDAQAAATARGVDFLGGVEISVEYEERELHVVGLGIALDNGPLGRLLEQLSEIRLERTRRILDRLRHAGTPLDDESLLSRVSGTSSGRMHVAVALHDAGAVRTVQDAFDRYLNRGKPAYVRKHLPPVEAAIAAIHDAGGLAFVAHPGLGNWIVRRLPQLLEMPFDGIEAWHVSHSAADARDFTALAAARGLLVSGGSDCHGGVKGDKPALGKVRVPMACYEKIMDRLGDVSRG